MTPFLHQTNHHPRFQGSSFIFIFYFLSLFGLYAPPSSPISNWAQSDPVLPQLPSLHIPDAPCPARLVHFSSVAVETRHNCPLLYIRFQISFARQSGQAGLPASSSCHSLPPGVFTIHPVVQAQPNFKLNRKCVLFF
jgi:hypothetical protein